MIRGVHHINIVVHDLAEARERYARLLGLHFAEPVELGARGALTSSAAAGSTRIVLVQPLRADSVPGRHLARRGEGLFLLSLDVEGDLDAEIAAAQARGARFESTLPRAGLERWSVVDFAPEQTRGGFELQLCADPDRDESPPRRAESGGGPAS